MTDVKKTKYMLKRFPSPRTTPPPVVSIETQGKHESLDESVVNAVYAHLQALRSLGKTHTHSADVARALELKRSTVLRAFAELEDKGVRIISS